MPQSERYACDESNAARIHDWLMTRGGILIWGTVSLSYPGKTWTTPFKDKDGNVASKPHYSCPTEPERHITSIDDVDVITAKEVKRFHVATRMGSQGMCIKVSDGGTRRIKSEVAKAREKYGSAWHEFDYFDEKNAVIMIEGDRVSMSEWARKNQCSSKETEKATT